MNPSLLIKRPTDFLLFNYLAVVASFLQADTRLMCQMMSIFGSMNPTAVIGIAIVVTIASATVVTTTFLPRYLYGAEALGAAFVHLTAFAIAAGSGAALRLLLTPAPECGSIQWPLDAEQWVTLFIVVVVAASVFTAVLNLATPQKADYTEVRERIRTYLEGLRSERLELTSDIRALLHRTRDAAERASMTDPSARYRHAITKEIVLPIDELLRIAETVQEDHPEEFLKRIGHRDPGLAPPDEVATASRAQRQLERIWWLPPAP